MKEVNSEQIENVLAMFSEMGINVVESEEAETGEATEEAREEPEEEESDGELVEVARTTPAETKQSVPAKRIEAGREGMIAGLCESPLTFQAIIIWRDELNDGKVFLRDIIDLEATYARPDAKNVAALALAEGAGNGPVGAAQPQMVAPATAPPAATPVWPKP